MKKNELRAYADIVNEQVSSWINNCDSKASILLALVGVISSIVFTSDFFLDGIVEMVRDLIDLIKGKGVENVCLTITILFIMVVTVLFFVNCIRELLLVLIARMDDSRDSNTPSICFYRSIASKSFEDYKQLVEGFEDDALIEDKLRQVHDCSRICTGKFTHYNKGIQSLRIGLVLFVVYIILFVVKSSL